MVIVSSYKIAAYGAAGGCVVFVPEKKSPPDYARVDLNSINSELPRTVGAEHVVYETIKLLEIDKC